MTSTDAGGLSVDEQFTITVTNGNEAPTAIALDGSTVAENAAGAVIGTLSTTDPDAGDTFTYSVDDERFEGCCCGLHCSSSGGRAIEPSA